jgi:hypothetical protein
MQWPIVIALDIAAPAQEKGSGPDITAVAVVSGPNN